MFINYLQSENPDFVSSFIGAFSNLEELNFLRVSDAEWLTGAQKLDKLKII